MSSSAGNKDLEVKVLITAEDRITKKLDEISAKLTAKSQKDLKKSLSVTEKKMSYIKKKLTWQLVNLPFSLLKKASSLAFSMASKVAGGYFGVLKKILSVTSEYTEKMRELRGVSVQTGLTPGTLEKLQYAAKAYNLDLERLNLGLEIFSKNIGGVRLGMSADSTDRGFGAGSLDKVLRRMKKGTREAILGAKTNDEALFLYLSVINDIPDAAKRAALAQKAFGKAGISLSRLLEKEGVVGLKRLMDERAAYGLTTSEMIEDAEAHGKALAKLDLSFLQLKYTIGAKLVPAFTPLVDRVSKFVTTFTKSKKFNESMQRMANAAGKFFEVFENNEQFFLDFMNKKLTKLTEILNDLAKGAANSNTFIGKWMVRMEELYNMMEAIFDIPFNYARGKLARESLKEAEKSEKMVPQQIQDILLNVDPEKMPPELYHLFDYIKYGEKGHWRWSQNKNYSILRGKYTGGMMASDLGEFEGRKIVSEALKSHVLNSVTGDYSEDDKKIMRAAITLEEIAERFAYDGTNGGYADRLLAASRDENATHIEVTVQAQPGTPVQSTVRRSGKTKTQTQWAPATGVTTRVIGVL